MLIHKRKVVVSILAATFLVALYFTIFSFSAQDGKESGNLSHMITEKCINFIDQLSGNQWNDVMKEKLITYFEHPIRKLAHFSEYALMGILVFLMLKPWVRIKKVCFYSIVIIWIFLSASLDELHQLFVPGRYSSFLDVLLDTFGGDFGVIVISIFFRVYYTLSKKEPS